MTTPLSTAPATDQQVDPSVRSVLINSCLALFSAIAITIFVHELGHFFSALAQGDSATLYPFGVLSDDSAGAERAWRAAAGPLVSLVVGALLLAWQPLRHNPGFGHLLWIFIAFTSLQEAVTYLVIAPFGAGDTAVIIESLGLPFFVAFIFLAIGVAGMFGTARLFADHVVRHVQHDVPRMRALAAWPWLITMVADMVLAFVYLVLSPGEFTAGEQIAVMAASTSIAVFAPMSFIFANKIQQPHVPLRLSERPIGGIVLAVALVLGNLALTRGFSL